MFYKNNLVKTIIDCGKRCGEKNYTPGSSGNISTRYHNGILITVSGSSNSFLSKKDIVHIDMQGNSLDRNKKPSSEKFLHLEIYRKRPDINFIIHVHSPFLTAFSSVGRDLLTPVMPENVLYFGGIPLAEYALPSSMQLVDNTVKYFDKYDLVMMANHGVVVGAKTMQDAYMKLEMAESYAQVVLYTEMLGGANILSKEEVQAILSLK